MVKAWPCCVPRSASVVVPVSAPSTCWPRARSWPVPVRSKRRRPLPSSVTEPSSDSAPFQPRPNAASDLMSTCPSMSVAVPPITPFAVAVSWSLPRSSACTVTIPSRRVACRSNRVVPVSAPSTSSRPSRSSVPVPVTLNACVPLVSVAVACASSAPDRPRPNTVRSGTVRSNFASSWPGMKLPCPSTVSCGFATRSCSTLNDPPSCWAMTLMLVRPFSVPSSSGTPTMRSVASPLRASRRMPWAPLIIASAVRLPASSGSASVRLASLRFARRLLASLDRVPCAVAVRRWALTARLRISIPSVPRRALRSMVDLPPISRSSWSWSIEMSVPSTRASMSKPRVSTV